MNIKVRYENLFKTYELNDAEAVMFARGLDVKGYKKLSRIRKQRDLQEMIDMKINRPEYNNYHKFERHRGNLPIMDLDEQFYSYDHMDLLPDNSSMNIMCRDIKDDSICKYLRRFFKNKPEYASVIIALFIDNYSIDEYAKICRKDRTTISRRCQKALKLLKNDETHKFLHELMSFVAI